MLDSEKSEAQLREERKERLARANNPIVSVPAKDVCLKDGTGTSQITSTNIISPRIEVSTKSAYRNGVGLNGNITPPGRKI